MILIFKFIKYLVYYFVTVDDINVEELQNGKEAPQQQLAHKDPFVKLVKPVFVQEQVIKRLEHPSDVLRRKPLGAVDSVGEQDA